MASRPSTARSRRTGATRSCSRLLVVVLFGAARASRSATRSAGSAERRARGDRVIALVLGGADRRRVLLQRRQAGPGRQPARESRRVRGAAADERRAGAGDRGQHPDAEGLRHRRHGAQRLRDRPRPAARLRRDHDRPPREARPRGAPGRHRPRAVARPQLRHPVLAARRRHGRRDRAPGRLLPALHVLGRRTGRRAKRSRGRRRRAPGDHVRRRASSWRSSRRSSAASSSWRSAASASTSPTRRRSS